MKRFIQRTALAAFLCLSVSLASAAVIKEVAANATDVSVVIKIIDLTDGSPETGVVFNTSGIDIEYWRHGANAVTDITEVTQTINAAHTDGGFVAIGNGLYRLDLPDAAVASGVDAVEIEGTVTGMIVIGGTVLISPPANVVSIAANAITATAINADAITAAKIANDAIGATEVADGAIDAATLATDTITAAKIAADSITSSELADNAIDAGAIATDAITAAKIAADAIAAAEIADGAIDEATFATTAGAFSSLGVVDQGTAQAATGTTLQLRSAAAFADDEIIGATCVITGGSAGVGQARSVTDYVSSTDTATVATWTTTPTGTITYKCFGTAAGSSGSVSIAAGGITASSFAAGAIDASAIAADAIGASELATDAIGAAEIATDAIGAAEVAASAIGASEIADGGITSTEFGSGAITATVIATDAIGAAEIATDVSTELLSGLANLAVNVAQVSGDATAADNIETAYDDTAGAVRWHSIVDQGTAQSATGTTLVLRAADAFADDELNGSFILITGGTTGVGQVRQISDYTGSTDTATVATWTTTPTGTITYRVLPNITAAAGGGLDAPGVRAAIGLASANLDTQLAAVQSDTDNLQTRVPAALVSGRIDASVGAVASGAIDAAAIAADAIGASELAADAIGAAEVANGAIDAATFASGAIDATAIATDAIGSAEVAAGAITNSELTATGTALTAVPWNASWDAEVQSEANDAIVANLLDRLLLNTYDPASPPGALDSLLEDLVENDAGVTRFTTNSLENGPAGGGGGSSDWSVGEREQIRHRLGIDGTSTAPTAAPSLATAAAVTALPALTAIAIRDAVSEDMGGGVSRGCIEAVMLAFAAGDIVTTGGTTIWKDPSNGETRFTSIVTSNGNRTSTIACPSY